MPSGSASTNRRICDFPQTLAQDWQRAEGGGFRQRIFSTPLEWLCLPRRLVGLIDHLSPCLRGKNTHFYYVIQLNWFNSLKRFLTTLVSVLVSATEGHNGFTTASRDRQDKSQQQN